MQQDEQDRADIARVLAVDTAAFAHIVERWQLRLINLAWRFTRDRAAAEDLAQDIFIRVYRSVSAYRGDSSFSTWITAVALNVCRSWVKSRGKPPLSLEHSPVDARPGPLHELEERQRAGLVQRAVLTLPERYRDAVILFYFEQKDLAAAAAVLGVPEGTLKARLHRARELLRQRCSKLVGVPPESRQPGVFQEEL